MKIDRSEIKVIDRVDEKFRIQNIKFEELMELQRIEMLDRINSMVQFQFLYNFTLWTGHLQFTG